MGYFKRQTKKFKNNIQKVIKKVFEECQDDEKDFTSNENDYLEKLVEEESIEIKQESDIDNSTILKQWK